MDELAIFVNEMRGKNTLKDIARTEQNLLYKCIRCKHCMSSSEYGPELEKFLKMHFQIDRAINNTSGDGHFQQKNIEIKVSLGDKEGTFSFVQIRPDHQVDFYLFLAYNLFEGNIGKIHLLLVPSDKIYELLPQYATYAHGTVDVLGQINAQNIFGRNCEYALRPNPNKNCNCKQRQLWDELLKYEINWTQSLNL